MPKRRAPGPRNGPHRRDTGRSGRAVPSSPAAAAGAHAAAGTPAKLQLRLKGGAVLPLAEGDGARDALPALAIR